MYEDKIEKYLCLISLTKKGKPLGDEEHNKLERDQELSKPLNGDSNNRRHLRIHKGSILLEVSRNPRNYNESDLGSRRDRLTLSGGIKIKKFFAIMWVYILNAFEN